MVVSIVELSAIHSNGFPHREVLWRCILKHDTLRTGLACMASSLVGVSDMVVSIVELSAMDSSSRCSPSWEPIACSSPSWGSPALTRRGEVLHRETRLHALLHRGIRGTSSAIIVNTFYTDQRQVQLQLPLLPSSPSPSSPSPSSAAPSPASPSSPLSEKSIQNRSRYKLRGTLNRLQIGPRTLSGRPKVTKSTPGATRERL